MVTRAFGLMLLLAAMGAAPLAAQSVTTELDVTVGRSTQEVQAASSQVRLFGDAVAGWRYSIEATWATVSGPRSDAFGGAYPYDKRVHVMEAYAERTFRPGRYVAGVRAGRYRTPFGIHNRSEHAYNGFLRAPLIRYGRNWALSNTFVEGGVSGLFGRPRLFVEASVGVPQDRDSYARQRGLDTVVRAQGALGQVILGASHIRTMPAQIFTFALGPSEFVGVDVRWMHAGIQLRGEWVDGRPFGPPVAWARTSGGYIDAIVHRPAMGPVTAVVRAERLDYRAGPFSSFPRRYTAGARVRLSKYAFAQANVIREHGDRRRAAGSAIDLALTFTARRTDGR